MSFMLIFAEADPAWIAGAFAVGLAIAGGVAFLIERVRSQVVKKRADEVLVQAQKDAENAKKQALLDAREEALRDREKLLKDVDQLRHEVREAERAVEKRESAVDNRQSQLDKRERTLENAQKKAVEATENYEKRRVILDKVLDEQREILLKCAGLDRNQAERLLLKRIDSDLAEEIGKRLVRHEQQLKDQLEARTREILTTAIQRYAAAHTADSTCSTIDLASDDLKGRIIGKEGRNIRAFEKATGVDVIVDDTPGVVVVSSFDGIRREIAKVAMQRLIGDGRIHPARIEEVVAEVREGIEEHIVELGKKAARDADVGKLHEKIIGLLGKLKFRTSYSQNVLQHSVEVALLSGVLAGELGLDEALARRCGLLHDIGKALDQEMEGGHPKIGADVAERCGENEIVVHAISGHHDDIRIDHIYTVLVAAADAISASRPGARRETLEKYVNRLKDLEQLCCEFDGVETAYAIQAGREVRVIADASKTSDKSAQKLSYDIAKSIEERLTYPGEIRVTVMRELRAVEYAR
jgi:ribonuclease Y